MTSLPATPCCVMNLASRSDAEDSNRLEITGFGALIGFIRIANCRLPIKTLVNADDLTNRKLAIGNWQSAIAWRIVSQRNDKVFPLKIAGLCFFRRFFAFY